MEKKKLISVRVRSHDVDKLKEICKRVGIRESDLFRFALRMLLIRFEPLRNPNSNGRDLVPLLMEVGTELANYFELDAERLAWIINEGVDDPAKRVDPRDIELLTMPTAQESYAYLRIKELTSGDLEHRTVASVVRKYMFEKYLATDSPPLPQVSGQANG